MTAQYMARAQVLFSQNRYELAEQQLRGWLANSPNDAEGHALLALSLSRQKKYDEATREAQQAVGLEPDLPLAHLALGEVLFDRNYLDEAWRAVGEAIRLDPDDESAWGMLAEIHFHRRQWSDALAAAEEGLAIDPENAACNNLRTMALERLGRSTDALQHAQVVLNRAPDDPDAHASQGWALLNSGRYQQAQVHFREALRLDPDNEFAREGMIQALNSRSRVFRTIFGFYSFMGRLSVTAQWGILIGLLVAQRINMALIRTYPALAPFLLPLVVGYFVFVIMTWTAHPLFNTFLRFHPFGRHLLNLEERWASNLIAGCMLGVLLTGTGWLLLGSWPHALLFGGYFLLMTMPIAGTFASHAGWPRFTMAAVTIGLAVWGLLGLAVSLVAANAAFFFAVVFGLGIFTSQILANVMVFSEVKK